MKTLKKFKVPFFLIALIAIYIVISLPLYVNYCLTADGIYFKLTRIEDLANGLRSGVFTIATAVDWESSLVCSGIDGNIFWLIPACLRLFGMQIETAYRTFLMCICLTAVIVAFVSFKGIFKDRHMALLGTMLYVQTPFFIDALYGRAAIGLALGYAFFPLIFLCIKKHFAGEDKQVWILDAVVMTLLLQSTLSMFLLGLFLVVFMVIFCHKEILTKTFWLQVAKACASFLIINLWYLLPLLKYLCSNRNVIYYVGGNSYQAKGLLLIHYLNLFFKGGTNYDFSGGTFENAASIGIGGTLLFAFLFYLWLWFSKQYSLKNNASKLIKGLFVLSIVGCVLSLQYFPWDFLRKSKVFKVLTFSSDSPTIFTVLSISGLVFMMLSIVDFCLKNKSTKKSLILISFIVMADFILTQYLTNTILITREPLWIYESEDLPSIVLNEAEELTFSFSGSGFELGLICLSITCLVIMAIFSFNCLRKSAKK